MLSDRIQPFYGMVCIIGCVFWLLPQNAFALTDRQSSVLPGASPAPRLSVELAQLVSLNSDPAVEDMFHSNTMGVPVIQVGYGQGWSSSLAIHGFPGIVPVSGNFDIRRLFHLNTTVRVAPWMAATRVNAAVGALQFAHLGVAVEFESEPFIVDFSQSLVIVGETKYAAVSPMKLPSLWNKHLGEGRPKTPHFIHLLPLVVDPGITWTVNAIHHLRFSPVQFRYRVHTDRLTLQISTAWVPVLFGGRVGWSMP